MRTLLVSLCFCLFLLPLHAQEQNVDPCATDDARLELLEQHPELRLEIEKFEGYQRQFAADYKNRNPNQRSGFIYIIPVVFHVLHNYGAENVTDEQIYNELTILNDDFRKRNIDIAEVIPQFELLATDCEIEFRLATRDPNHNPTNGIDRIQSMETYQGTNDSKLNQWPRDMYLNIWVAQEVQQSTAGGETLAYAYLPPDVEGPRASLDGIVTKSNSVGNIGVGIPNRSRTVTHEVGHFLGLTHTWGGIPSPGQTCGDDNIEDTPITAGTFGCNLTLASCSHGDIIENVQNFMDYSGCSKMFTEGQKVAMIASLNSNVSQRMNLWQESNLHITGADISTNENSIAPPVADFYAPIKMACVGDQLSFKDFSWSGPITAWEWEFSNATPSTSPDKNPTVVFDAPGWQTVSLKVTSALGENQKVMERYIYITDVSQTVPSQFRDGFENPDEFTDKWFVNNIDNNTTKWQTTTSASYTGGVSLFLNNFQGNYDKDEVVTPVYDLLNGSATDLQFQYSYASKSPSGSDGLKDTLTVYYSTTCGRTWVQMYRQSGAALLTAGNYIYNFIPDRENLWKQVSIALPALAKASSNVRFKFTFANGGSANNMFLDNINIDDAYRSTVGIDQPKQVASLNVYPVPSSGQFNVEFSTTKASTVRIELFDLLGKNITEQNYDAHSGANIIPMQLDLPTGIYTLSVSAHGERTVKKVSIVR